MAIQMAPIVLASMAKFGLKYLTKPKYKKPDTGYLDRHSANLRSDLASKDTYHTTMRAVLKNIGRESGKLQRTMDYDTALRGEDDSGVNIQKRISAHGKTLSAMKDASIQASEMQATEDRRFHAQLDEVMLIKEKIVAEAKHRYGLEKDQWEKEMLVEGASGALNIGMGAFQQAGEWKNAFDTAKMNNADLTMEAFKKMGGTAETALAKFGHEFGKTQTSSALPMYGDLAKQTFESIRDNFASGKIGEKDARDMISLKLKLQNDDLETDWYIGEDNLEHEQALFNGNWIDTGVTRKASFKKTKDDIWWTQTGPTEESEYKWDEKNQELATGRVRSRYQAPKTLSAGEQRALSQSEAEREASIFALTNDLDYRRRQGIGDTAKIDSIEELMKEGVDQFESKKASDLINTYVRSITEEDLQKIGLSEMTELNSIISDLFGGEISRLDAYRFKVRRDFKSAFDRYIRKGNFNPNEELKNWTND